jgi:hypothetical protein
MENVSPEAQRMMEAEIKKILLPLDFLKIKIAYFQHEIIEIEERRKKTQDETGRNE